MYAHHEKGGDSAPLQADKPGDVNSGEQTTNLLVIVLLLIRSPQTLGAQGKEYPTRFFARDYAGNRLEFSL